MTIARSIDHVFAAFEAGALAQGASQHELDRLVAWPWPPGFVPTVPVLEALLVALRKQKVHPLRTHPAQTKLAPRQAKVAG
jgi:hypothetical protein